MSLVLELEFLTGRCVASRRDDRATAEWPPHPTRLFSALAAAFFECGFGDAERAALQWLEQQNPPAIAAPRVWIRTAVASFVPVNPGEKEENDQYMKRKKITIFPKIDEGIDFRRNRQMRHFPTTIPETATVVYRWDDVDEEQAKQHRPALQRLAQNLTYLGHSSSMVRAGLCETPPEPTWRPAKNGELPDATLRVPNSGRLASLEKAYELSLKANRRIEPPEGAFRGYVLTGRGDRLHVVRGVFDERLIIFHCKAGPGVPLHASLKLTSTVRKALIDLADQPVPEVLSGHLSNGEKSNQPHVAVIPLPNVGSRYSTGSIMGFAVVLPRSLSQATLRDERIAVLKAIGRLQSVQLGSAGVWQLERLTAESDYKTLQPTRYTQASKRWASITPVVFGRFPKNLDSKEAKQMVCEHCRMIGLPEPRRVEIMNVSPVLGVPPASHFSTLSTAGKPVGILFEKGRNRLPKIPQGQAQPRVRAHVFVEFSEPICGPVLLGAGRYFGMGLCLPAARFQVFRSEP